MATTPEVATEVTLPSDNSFPFRILRITEVGTAAGPGRCDS